MAINKKQQLAESVRGVFQVLMQHPEGLSTKDLWERLNQILNQQSEANPSFEEVSFACVGPIKAGWLVVNHHWWLLSPEGKKAYEDYRDPRRLMTEAGKRSSQGWLAVHFPRAYSTAGKTKDQVTSEVRTARRVGVSRLLKQAFGKTTPWQEVLPIQSPRTISLAGIDFPSGESLVNYLRGVGVPYSEGAHTIYLAPQSIERTMFKSLLNDYPSNIGIKIVKNPGGVESGGYLTGRAKGDSRIQLGMVHGHRHLSLVANFLYLMGIGPRLYDLLNLNFGDQHWTAYLVEDVGDRMPTAAECEAGIQRLRQLDSQGFIRVILPEGFEDPEFECPACGNNALVDSEGQFRYIDFQNFLLGNYEKFLTELATEAAKKSHFGDTNVLRGGRYLYQSVPGVKLPGKRNVANRMETLSELLKEANVSVTERVVLDVGCNIGMMMAEYLRLGARWCHGWDRAVVTPHTEKMLLALGCTRFSTTGTDITRSRALMDDLPEHVRTSLHACVISYLAVRGHLDWLDALKQIPWSFLIYEGHEGETHEEFETYLQNLKRLTNFELGPQSTYIDGDSEERTVAILLNRAR